MPNFTDPLGWARQFDPARLEANTWACQNLTAAAEYRNELIAILNAELNAGLLGQRFTAIIMLLVSFILGTICGLCLHFLFEKHDAIVVFRYYKSIASQNTQIVCYAMILLVLIACFVVLIACFVVLLASLFMVVLI